MGSTSRDKPIRSKRRLKPSHPQAAPPKVEEKSCDDKKKSLIAESTSKPVKLLGTEENLSEIENCIEEAEEGDWNYCTEDQLQELLLKNLEYVYTEAVNKIKSLGYSEEDVLKAVLRNGHCYGASDILTNIVNNSLAFLRSGNASNFDESDMLFKDLKQLEEYALTGMVCMLRQVRPQLSKGDAMWCLLMSDLHVGRANTLEVPSLTRGEKTAVKAAGNCPPSSTGISMPSPIRPSGTATNFIPLNSESCRTCAEAKRLSALSLNTSNASLETTLSQNSFAFDTEGMHISSASKPLNSTSPNVSSSMKFTLFKKNVSALLSNKHPAVRKLKSEICSQSVDAHCDCLSSITSSQSAQIESVLGCHKNQGFKQVQDVQSENERDTTGATIAGTDLSLGIAPSIDSGQGKCRAEFRNCHEIVGAILGSLDHMGITDKSDGIDHRNEIMLKLIHQVRDLEMQLKERIDWAHKKAMQAAKKLSNDLAELKILRMEREELQRLKKDKQALEETTVKRLAEMESAWRKAHAQLDRANSAIKRLQEENAELKAEMEACKLSASESIASCQDIAKKEKKFLKRAQAWEKQKAKIQEEIRDDKQKVTQLLQELSLLEDMQKETEMKLKQEEVAKERANAQAEEARRTRDTAEAASRRREEALRRKIEMDFERYKDDIERLEQERNRLKLNASQPQSTSNHPYSFDGRYVQKIQEKNANGQREIQESSKDINNDRQCRQCSVEEASVLFLPCAHQVICVKCNELHENKGSKNCPSCKTPIQQRIRVYGVSS